MNSTQEHSAVVQKKAASRTKKGCRGFTLIELMIVVSIIGILAAIAVPNYQWSVIKAREAVLLESLYNFNSSLDQFKADTGEYPKSLDELVSKKYMKGLPKDPFTNSSDTWVYTPPPESQDNGKDFEIPSVYSGSDKISPTNNKPYREW